MLTAICYITQFYSRRGYFFKIILWIGKTIYIGHICQLRHTLNIQIKRYRRALWNVEFWTVFVLKNFVLKLILVPAFAILFSNPDDSNITANVVVVSRRSAPDYGINVRQDLDEVFPGRWIGGTCTIAP